MENGIKKQTVDALMDDDGCVVCIKDNEGKVLKQNQRCIDNCDNRVGKKCSDGCMIFYATLVENKGAGNRPRVLPSCHINGRYYDVVFLRGKEHLTTVLYPIEEKVTDAISSLDSYSLTPREREIAELILVGLSNRDVMKKLTISKSTLKTHLNRIYKKLGSDKEKLVTRLS